MQELATNLDIYPTIYPLITYHLNPSDKESLATKIAHSPWKFAIFRKKLKMLLSFLNIYLFFSFSKNFEGMSSSTPTLRMCHILVLGKRALKKGKKKGKKEKERYLQRRKEIYLKKVKGIESSSMDAYLQVKGNNYLKCNYIRAMLLRVH